MTVGRYPLAPDQIALRNYQAQLAFDEELRNTDHRYASFGYVDYGRAASLREGIAGRLADSELAGPFLPHGTTTVLRAEFGPGALAGVNVQTQAAFAVPISGDPVSAPTLLKIDYDGKRFLPALLISVLNFEMTRGLQARACSTLVILLSRRRSSTSVTPDPHPCLATAY